MRHPNSWSSLILSPQSRAAAEQRRATLTPISLGQLDCAIWTPIGKFHSGMGAHIGGQTWRAAFSIGTYERQRAPRSRGQSTALYRVRALLHQSLLFPNRTRLVGAD